MSYHTVNIERFLTNSVMPLKYKKKCDKWEVNQLGQMLQFQQHVFRAVFFPKWRQVPCIMTSSIIPSPSILNIWKGRGFTSLCTISVSSCLVPVRRLARLSRSMHFGDESETNGRATWPKMHRPRIITMPKYSTRRYNVFLLSQTLAQATHPHVSI